MPRQTSSILYCSVTPFDPAPLWALANATQTDSVLPARSRRRTMFVTASVAVTLEAVAVLALNLA